MNALEAMDLLDMLSMVDNRNVSVEMADAWAWALADVEAPRAVLAAQRILRGEGRRSNGEQRRWIDARAIREQLVEMQPGFERDVRSAKARGLIDFSWDARTPLPVAIEQQLRAVQGDQWASTNDRPEEITAAPHVTRRTIAGPTEIRDVLAAALPKQATQ